MPAFVFFLLSPMLSGLHLCKHTEVDFDVPYFSRETGIYNIIIVIYEYIFEKETI